MTQSSNDDSPDQDLIFLSVISAAQLMSVGRPVENRADTRDILGVTKILERLSEDYHLRCNEND